VHELLVHELLVHELPVHELLVHELLVRQLWCVFIYPGENVAGYMEEAVPDAVYENYRGAV
jgi:hypothetical protein